jgi:energy-converting hydrogenase Eha subunit E
MEEIPIATEISECRIIIDDSVVDPVEAVVNAVVEPVNVVRVNEQYTHTREIISFIICATIIISFFTIIMLAFTN